MVSCLGVVCLRFSSWFPPVLALVAAPVPLTGAGFETTGLEDAEFAGVAEDGGCEPAAGFAEVPGPEPGDAAGSLVAEAAELALAGWG